MRNDCLLARQMQNRGNPWSSRYEGTSSIKDQEDEESVAELLEVEDSKDEDERSDDEARTESSGHDGGSAAEATAGSDATASQKGEEDEDFKELLVRYR